MNVISLKIVLPRQGVDKITNFPLDMSVAKACREIRAQFFPGDEEGGLDHALFWVSQGKWLENGKIIGFYDFRNGDTVEYKKKHRPVPVKLVDGSLKTILLDESLHVSKLAEQICNHLSIPHPNEYSLAMDVVQESTETTLFMKKTKEVIKEKWLKPYKSLTEQGITENRAVCLKKKFFFNDQDINKKDLVQLGLAYALAKNSVLNNDFLCTQDEAVKFAAMQCQVQFENYKPEIHKHGFLITEDFLPKDYAKKKDIEKKIYIEYSKMKDLSETEAQYRYIQLCYSLQFHGVTFFNVVEIDSKKNKFKRLLGISRDGVISVDPETKQILNKWSLYNIRRWASTPTTFVLDFGDYADKNHVVLTSEGELIAQYISGYIDIIVQKRKMAERAVEDDEIMMVTEEDVIAIPASVVANAPGHQGLIENITVAQTGEIVNGDMLFDNATYFGKDRINGFSNATALDLLQKTIGIAIYSINSAQNELELIPPMPTLPFEDDMVGHWRQRTLDSNMQLASTYASSVLVSTASIVGLVNIGESIDYTAIAMNVSSSATDLTQLLGNLKVVASLQYQEDELSSLVEVSSKVSAADVAFLETLRKYCRGECTREDLLAASQAVGSAIALLLAKTDDRMLSNMTQQDMIDHAERVAIALSAFIDRSRGIADGLDDSNAKAELLELAKQTFAKGNQIIYAVSVMSPAMNSDLCRDQLEGTVKELEISMALLIAKARQSSHDDDALRKLEIAGQDLTSAHTLLLATAINGDDKQEGIDDLDRLIAIILEAAHNIQTNLRDSTLLVQNAQILAKTTTEVVTRLKLKAEAESDPDEKHRLLVAVRELADATTKVINSAKEANKNPDSVEAKANLDNAVTELEVAVLFSTAANNKDKIFRKLASAAKAVATYNTQFVSSVKSAAPSNRNTESQIQLIASTRNIADSTSQMVTAIRTYNRNRDDTLAKLGLVGASKNVIGPSLTLLAAGRAATPTIGDPTAQAQLNRSCNGSAHAINDLRNCVAAAEMLTCTLALDCAVTVLQKLAKDVQDTKAKVEGDGLNVSVSSNSDEIQLQIYALARAVNGSATQLIAAANRSEEDRTGIFATDYLTGLQSIVQNSALLCTFDHDRAGLLVFLVAEELVLANAITLIVDAKVALRLSNDVTIREKTQKDIAEFTMSMSQFLDRMPSQYQTAEVINSIRRLMEALQNGRLENVDIDEDLPAALERINQAVLNYNIAANQLLNASQSSPEEFHSALKNFEKAILELSLAEVSVAYHTPKEAQKSEIVSKSMNVFDSTNKVLDNSKHISANPYDVQVKNNFATSIQNSIGAATVLLQVCNMSNSGMQDCQQALLVLDASAEKMHKIPDNADMKYAECLARAKVFRNETITTLSATIISAKAHNPDEMARTLKDDFSEEITKTTNIVAIAASLLPEQPESQQAIIVAGGMLLKRSQDFVRTAETYCSDPRNIGVVQLLSIQSKAVSDAFQNLVVNMEQNSPGYQEIDDAIERIKNHLAQLDSAAVQINLSDGAHMLLSSNFQESRTNVHNASDSLTEKSIVLANFFLESHSKLPIKVQALAEATTTYVISVIEAAASVPSNNAQMKILEDCTVVMLNLQQLLEACKAITNDYESEEYANNMKFCSENLTLAMATLLQKIDFSAENDEFEEIIRKIKMEGEKSIDSDAIEESYSVYIDSLVKCAKKLANEVGDSFSKLSKSGEKTRVIAEKIFVDYAETMAELRKVAKSSLSEEKTTLMEANMESLTLVTTQFVEALKIVHNYPDDMKARQNVCVAGRELSNKIGLIIQCSKEGSKGSFACEEATSRIDLILSDLYMASLIASLGQMEQAPDDIQSYEYYRDEILAATKHLSSTVNNINDSINGRQEELPQHLEETVAIVTAIKDNSKKAAAALSSKDKASQEKILNSTKSVCISIKTLSEKSSHALGRSPASNEVKTVDKSANAALEAIVELEKAVKKISDKQTRVALAMEDHLNSIMAVTTMKFFDHIPNDEEESDPIAVINASKQVSASAASIVSSTFAPEDELLGALKSYASCIEDLSTKGRRAVAHANSEQRLQMAKSVSRIGGASTSLFANLQEVRDNEAYEERVKVLNAAKNVADTCGQVADVANNLVPGGAIANKTTMFADKELLQAAEMIEEALNKLSRFQKTSNLTDETKFEAGLIGAVRAIAAATSALIVSATAAQAEISKFESSSVYDTKKMYFSDGTWSQGLVSAANTIAAATAELCESTNLAVQGKMEYESVVASARAVSASTVQLLTAATVKLDSLSPSREKLAQVARKIRDGSEQLVKFAQAASAKDGGDLDKTVGDMMKGVTPTTLKVFEMEAQTNVLKLEKELQRAREKLSTIRKKRYEQQQPNGGATAIPGH